jgi:hypothetical protein
MSESPETPQHDGPPTTNRHKWMLPAVALVAVVCALAWWTRQTGSMVDRFRSAIVDRDADALVRLARVAQRPAVLTEAKTIWRLCSPPGRDAGPLQRGSCRVHVLAPSLWERLRGRRDLLVLAVDPQSGSGIDVFYYRIRANRLHAGADPRKFDDLELVAQRLLADTGP